MDAVEKTGYAAIVVACSAVFSLAVWTVVGSIRSNGETDYCYIEMWSPPQMAPQWLLKGHRPWRMDRDVGIYASVDDAKAKADLLSCKLGAK